MENKKAKLRITLDLPLSQHKQLKTVAAVLGKSMKELMIEALEKHLRSVISKNIDKEPTFKNL